MDTAAPCFSLHQFQWPSRWITLERPKIERIVPPSLVLRFIDRDGVTTAGAPR